MKMATSKSTKTSSKPQTQQELDKVLTKEQESVVPFAEVEVWIPQYHPTTGEAHTTPNVVKYMKKEWKQFVQNPLGYKITKVIKVPEDFEPIPESLMHTFRG
jgi:hypothetical protein